ncbi:MAG TPA: hypothetical protein VGW98_11590 [Solirubrobacteraceae bacterium]|nr:hypothetical protein [Solirubrobacteraceae bacterium]
MAAELSGKPNPRPLAQRDALRAEQKAAYESYTKYTVMRQKSERVKAAAERNLAAVEEAMAKGTGGTDEQREEMALRLEEANATYEKALRISNKALATTKTLDADLNQLYGEYFDDFAYEADKASKLADDAISAMVDAYRRAQVAWAEAQVMWTPVCHALRIENLGPFPLTDGDMAGIVQGWKSKPKAIELLPYEPGEAMDEQAILGGLDVAG